MTITKLFLDLPNPFESEWSLRSLSSKISVFFKYDMALTAAAAIGQGLYSVWCLREQGYVTTSTAVKAASAVIAGQFLFGYGATWAGLWVWREGVISGLATGK
jgi:hypothetical protein